MATHSGIPAAPTADSPARKRETLEYANLNYTHTVPTVIKFQGHSKPFLEFQFGINVTLDIKSRPLRRPRVSE